MIIQGDCLKELDKLDENSADSIVTDPPYELNFMGKGWDSAGVSFSKDTWAKCLRVLKPGGYLLAFGGTRTYHRIACAIEDAGFEIRDCVLWLYGSGFPKSMNIGLAIDKKMGVESIDTGVASLNARPDCDKSNTLYKSGTVGKSFTIKKARNEWDGWGTCLKPAYEPIIVARKPFKGSLVENVMNNRVGGLNIDECRVSASGGSSGRFPANLVLTYDGNDYEEVCGGMPKTGPTRPHGGDGKKLDTRGQGWGFKRMPSTMSDDGGSAARYFYCAKASKRDRDEGMVAGGKNIHPTVKPTSLMQYLVRLVTPKGGTVLDPFMGSGSTGKAVMYENKDRNANYKFVGIELSEEYCKIAEARINYVKEVK